MVTTRGIVCVCVCVCGVAIRGSGSNNEVEVQMRLFIILIQSKGKNPSTDDNVQRLEKASTHYTSDLQRSSHFPSSPPL